MQTTSVDFSEYILPLNMNGLSGRMLKLPSRSKFSREILVVYSQLDTIESCLDLAIQLQLYGNVTLPDLPGFGGMTSLYKIGEKPTLDELADYLAAFMKLSYKRRRVTVVGVGFGFVILTRMLQRYPDLVKKIDLVVSIKGYAHHDDLRINEGLTLLYRFLAWVGSRKYLGWVLSRSLLRPLVIASVLYSFKNYLKPPLKLEGISFKEARRRVIELFKLSDSRTFFMAGLASLTLDNCRVPVELPLAHLSVNRGWYLDKHLVEQHLRVVYAKTTSYEIKKYTGKLLGGSVSNIKIPRSLRLELRRT
jgi:pimeloyl-ACP methyl ester carboxylesterase